MADPNDPNTMDAEARLAAALGGISLQQQRLRQRQARAQALMGTPLPQGQQIGRIYKAASPVEALASALVRFKGSRDLDAIDKEYEPLAQQATQAQAQHLAYDNRPAPPEWGVPPGMSRSEAMKVMPTILGRQNAPKNKPVPDAILEGLGMRGNYSGSELDALRDNPDVAWKLYGEKPEAPPDVLEPDLVSRATKLGVPAQGRKREPVIADILAAERAAADRAAAKETESTKTKAEAGKTADDLRKDFQSQQVYKDTEQVATAYKKISSTSPTGPGDMSLVYAYMKLVDPGSTVREGEFATAEQAGGVPARVVNLYNKAINGERLPDNVRAEFRAEAKKMLGAQADRFNAKAEEYKRLATQRGIAPGDVVLDMGLGPLLAPPAPPAAVRKYNPATGRVE